VLVGRVVDDEVEDQPDAALARFPSEVREVAQAAKP
jgi:hypothetical protein